MDDLISIAVIFRYFTPKYEAWHLHKQKLRMLINKILVQSETIYDTFWLISRVLKRLSIKHLSN